MIGKIFKPRRGLDSNRKSITPKAGELILTTDKRQIFLGDGETPGGNMINTIFVFEWEFDSAAAQVDYSPAAESEPFHDPTGGVYLVFYGGIKLNKKDYSIDTENNKITLGFDPLEDGIELHIIYTGI